VRATASSLTSDIAAGFRYVWRERLLRNLALQIVCVNVLGSVMTAELALFASRRLGADNTRVGELFAAPEVGVIIISLVTGRLGARLGLRRMLLLALVVYGGGFAVLGLLTSYPAALVMEAVIGGGTVLYNVSTTSWRQRLVPNALLGRVSSVTLTFAWSAIPLGSLAGGAVIGASGAVAPVYVAAGLGIVVVGLGFHRLNRSVDAVPPDVPRATEAQDERPEHRS